MTPKNIKQLVAGTLLGTLIGTASFILFPKRQKLLCGLKTQSKGWGEQAKHISESMLDEMKFWSKSKQKTSTILSFMKGMFTGMLVGSGTTLLTTPKSGRQLRNQLTKRYHDVADKTQDALDYMHNGLEEAIVKKPRKVVPKLIKKVLTPKKPRARATAKSSDKDQASDARSNKES